MRRTGRPFPRRFTDGVLKQLNDGGHSMQNKNVVIVG